MTASYASRSVRGHLTSPTRSRGGGNPGATIGESVLGAPGSPPPSAGPSGLVEIAISVRRRPRDLHDNRLGGCLRIGRGGDRTTDDEIVGAGLDRSRRSHDAFL